MELFGTKKLNRIKFSFVFIIYQVTAYQVISYRINTYELTYLATIQRCSMNY